MAEGDLASIGNAPGIFTSKKEMTGMGVLS
jgi:hypothetical protein